LRRACEELGPIFVKFGQILSTRPDLVPPDIVCELNALQDNVAPFSVDYCALEVMVTERIYGIPITNIAKLEAQNTDMQKLAERGVEIFFTQVFEQNFFHADMHPGNIFVSEENPEHPKYIAVDMAIVGSLAREDQYYLARNMLAMFRRDYRQVAELHVQSGWVPKDTKIGEFEAAVRMVCEPVFEKPLAEISFGKVLINLFATAQRFNMEVQPQLVLLQKTLL